MSLMSTASPTRALATGGCDTAGPDHHQEPSRISVVLEALAYAGASIDPATALAARRFARIRDRERRHGRW